MMSEQMQEPTGHELPPRLVGETDRDYERRLSWWFLGEHVRVKGDLRDWATGIFHLSREPFR